MNNPKPYLPLLLALAASSLCGCRTPANHGEAGVPLPLEESIAKRFPGFRFTPVSAYRKEDLEFGRKQLGSHASPTVARADVDGDGTDDFAVLLDNTSGTTLLVAARALGPGLWDIAKLSQWTDTAGRSYVDVLPPGEYLDISARPGNPYGVVPDAGGVQRYSSIHPGFVSGTLESSAVAYFLAGKKWLHLWLSD